MQEPKLSRPDSQPSCPESLPWWVYPLFAGSDVAGRVLSARFSGNGNHQKSTKGVNIRQTEDIKPGIDPEKISSTSIIGQRVMGSDGKQLGKIEEITLDLTTGTVAYFVLSSGGVFGIGDRFYALPPQTLTLKPEEKTFYLGIDKKTLKQMPKIDKNNWPQKASWPIMRPEFQNYTRSQ